MGKKEELTEEQPRKRSVKLRLVVFGLKLGVTLAVCLGVAHLAHQTFEVLSAHAMRAREMLLERVTITKVVTEYREIDDATLGDIIAKTSKDHGVDPLVMAVLAEKESRGGEALYRFEPGKFDELRGSKSYRNMPTDEVRMIASSHGVFHIMGYSARQYCDLAWHRLYDPWTSARCAAKIVKKHQKDTEHIKAPSARVREVFRRYNGTGDMADRYADDAMNRLAGILYDRVAKAKS